MSAAKKKQSLPAQDFIEVDGGVTVMMGDRPIKLTWNNRALARVSAKGCQTWDESKSIWYLCVYIWAMTDGCDSPEQMAEMLPLTDEEKLSPIMDAVTRAVELGSKKKR